MEKPTGYTIRCAKKTIKIIRNRFIIRQDSSPIKIKRDKIWGTSKWALKWAIFLVVYFEIDMHIQAWPILYGLYCMAHTVCCMAHTLSLGHLGSLLGCPVYGAVGKGSW